jgi:hypothetical protein
MLLLPTQVLAALMMAVVYVQMATSGEQGIARQEQAATFVSATPTRPVPPGFQPTLVSGQAPSNPSSLQGASPLPSAVQTFTASLATAPAGTSVPPASQTPPPTPTRPPAPIVAAATAVAPTATPPPAPPAATPAATAPAPTQTPAPPPAPPALTASGPLVIDGDANRVIENLQISNPNGDCVQIVHGSNIQVKNLKIGPCAGRGILVRDSQGVTITGTTIEPGTKPARCCDTGSGIFSLRNTNLVIESTQISHAETNIQVQGSTDVRIANNSLFDPLGPFPRGQQIQIAGIGTGSPSRNVTVSGNTLLCSSASCSQEDAINVHYADNVVITGNNVRGGVSASGCGVLLDLGARNVTVRQNHAIGQQCGIGVASGYNHLIEGNEVSGYTNVGMYVEKYGAECHAITFRSNKAGLGDRQQSNPFYRGQRCLDVTVEGNSWQNP